MNQKHIIITAEDRTKLVRMLTSGELSPREQHEAQGLEAELARAQIVAGDRVPPDVITMNSRAELIDLTTGETMEFTVVFPADADIDAGRISVLAPIGTGMLGYRVNDVFEQTAPRGIRRLKVVGVSFQPEAALAAV